MNHHDNIEPFALLPSPFTLPQNNYQLSIFNYQLMFMPVKH